MELKVTSLLKDKNLLDWKWKTVFGQMWFSISIPQTKWHQMSKDISGKFK